LKKENDDSDLDPVNNRDIDNIDSRLLVVAGTANTQQARKAQDLPSASQVTNQRGIASTAAAAQLVRHSGGL
jgi:hypothetical protein